MIPITLLVLLLTIGPSSAFAEDPRIESALSAGPSALTQHATVQAWDGTVLQKGSNGWTCLPDRAETPGTDPWCVNKPWLNFLNAWKTQTNPTYIEVGVAYMLQGDTPVSNTDPFATEPTSSADWVTGLGPHLMILVPDKDMLDEVPTDWQYGGPWIMWKDTPYAHLMIPLGGE